MGVVGYPTQAGTPLPGFGDNVAGLPAPSTSLFSASSPSATPTASAASPAGALQPSGGGSDLGYQPVNMGRGYNVDAAGNPIITYSQGVLDQWNTRLNPNFKYAMGPTPTSAPSLIYSGSGELPSSGFNGSGAYVMKAGESRPADALMPQNFRFPDSGGGWAGGDPGYAVPSNPFPSAAQPAQTQNPVSAYINSILGGQQAQQQQSLYGNNSLLSLLGMFGGSNLTSNTGDQNSLQYLLTLLGGLGDNFTTTRPRYNLFY